MDVLRTPADATATSVAPDPLRELARLAATGDGAATSQLLRELAPKLVRIVRAVLGAHHADVDDATQLALIGFVQALPAYRGDCEPLSYGRIIAVRAAIAVRKRARARSQRQEEESAADRVAEARPTPGESAASAQRKNLLRELLDELPVEQAEALAMRVVLGCSLDEVAARAGAPVNTIRSRVRLAKERLRARIESDPTLVDLFEVES